MDIADFSLDLFSLAGRSALVTGGNSGLGRAFSLALAKGGADVFAVGLAEDDGTTRRLVEGAGRRMEFMTADITQPGVPAAIVHHCVEMLGSVDILVNSAGIALLSDVAEFGRDLWDPMVSVNLTAGFELAYEASKFMIRQRSWQDHQYCLAILLHRRQALARLCRDQSRNRRLHQGLLRRAGELQHPGQCHRAGILQDSDHRSDACRSRRRSPHRRAHTFGPLG